MAPGLELHDEDGHEEGVRTGNGALNSSSDSKVSLIETSFHCPITSILRLDIL
jgi:hypothetical protein